MAREDSEADCCRLSHVLEILSRSMLRRAPLSSLLAKSGTVTRDNMEVHVPLFASQSLVHLEIDALGRN